MNPKDPGQRGRTWLRQSLARVRRSDKLSARRNQILLVSGTILFLLAATGFVWARRIVRRGWPQTQGELTLAGLYESVTVVRDGYGVPHIYATSEADLFFTQGYVHAQDRFWQMELSRRRGRGTLTTILGQEALATDQVWRSLNLVETASRKLAATDADSRALLQAYAAGVNAWQERHRGRWPLEYTLLRWRGRTADAPSPWTAEDSLIVSLVLGWQVDADWIDPSLAARLVERVGSERGAFLLGGSATAPAQTGRETVLQASDQATGPLPGRWALGGRATLVSGDRTASGQALWAVDLPTDLSLPAPWYVMTWHVGDEGVAGASVPGLPGLVVGTGERVTGEAWLGIQESVPWDDEGAPRTRDDFQAWQTDTFSSRAARLIPFLLQVKPQGWRQERVTGMLRQWDYKIGNNKEAPFFAVYQRELARAALSDELGEGLFEAFAARGDLYQVALDRIIENPDDEWWDDVSTPQRELRHDILKRAYEPALEWIGRNYGDLHMLWEWDIVHGSRLQHPLGDAWPWDQLLNSDIGLDGWADTVNASPGGRPEGRLRMGGDFFRAQAAYGYRQIVDLSDPSTLWFVLLPGQSGHPFHAHYDDLMDEWLAGEYLPLRLAASPEDVDGAEGVLILRPED